MRIVAPMSAAAEARPLAEAGADELYCGIVPEEWTKRFNTSGTNRRIFGNFSTYSELETAISAAHAVGSQVSLVMNAQHYAEEHMEALVAMADRFAAIGGDALIVGDIGLLALLTEEGTQLRLHVSSLLTCRNADAARVYRDLGAHRIILPRDVTLGEAAAIAAAMPDMEIEAFVLNDGCVFEEGSCHTIHLPGKLGGPICLDSYETDYFRINGKPCNETELQTLADNEGHYRRFLWHRFSCGFTVSGEGYPYGPCGLCAMPFFARFGLTAVKIAGRESSLARKLKSVEMVQTIRRMLEAGKDEAEISSHARGIRGGAHLCLTGYMCYYREVLKILPAFNRKESARQNTLADF